MVVNDTSKQPAGLAEKLRDPLRMQIAVTAVVLLIGYFAVSSPLSEATGRARRELRAEEQRWQLAQEIEVLEAHASRFQSRIAVGWDANQWIQYVLDGVRERPLVLQDLDSRGTYAIGPYRAIEMQLQVVGESAALDSLLHWLETNDRLFRIETLKLEPARGSTDKQLATLTFVALQA